MTEYRDLIEFTGLEVVADHVFGSYQGDLLFVVKDGDRTGAVVVGYGSCSGCDALEDADKFEDWDKPAPDVIAGNERMQELAWSIRRDVKWGTATELRAALDNDLEWYRHEDDFTAALDKALPTLAARRGTAETGDDDE
jgi:hypothetical protein